MSSKYTSPYVEVEQPAQTFEEELGELIRRAEDEGVDLLCARDIEASEEGYKYMIEISRVQDF